MITEINQKLQAYWAAGIGCGEPEHKIEALDAQLRNAMSMEVVRAQAGFHEVLSALLVITEGADKSPDAAHREIDGYMLKLAEAALSSKLNRRKDVGAQALFIAGYGAESEKASSHLLSLGIQVMAVAGVDAIQDLGSLVDQVEVVIIGSQIITCENEAKIQMMTKFMSEAKRDRMVLIVTDTPPPLDFKMRLVASRFGKVQIFNSGEDYKHLCDIVRNRGMSADVDGYKVLLVDDSHTDAYVASKYLREDGLDVMHIHDPAEVLKAIHDFRPDVIVTDLHMPVCNGDQMARIIRQDRDATMPIVFLSSETNDDTQLRALASGADGFIRKPLARGPFTAAIKSIIARSVSLESRMRRDPLTNLLNHGQYIASARRLAASNTQCVAVAIDIDHFKSVNDRFGHPTGDKVIVAIAETLTECLRTSDFIGRMGGEEFGVLMVGTTPSQAKEVVERLLKKFREIVFKSPAGVGFQCTFSAGLVTLGSDASRSLHQADNCLYISKRAGRNIVTALGE